MPQAQELRGVTICTERAGLQAGTTSTYTTDNAVNGAIKGEFVTELAAQTNTATETTDFNGDAFTVVKKSQASVFVFSLIADGSVEIHQGDVVDLDTDTDDYIDGKVPGFPGIDLNTYMPFGFVVVKNASNGSDWTFGSSSWTAAGITDTFTDVATLPVRPQTS